MSETVVPFERFGVDIAANQRLVVIPRQQTVEIWIDGAATDCRQLVVLTEKDARDLEAALARSLARLGRNRRVIAADAGIYPKKAAKAVKNG